MASIVITVQPLDQVVPGGDNPTAISVTATYDGIETLLYQWYKCDDALGTNPEVIELGTTNTLTFGTMEPGATYYYYCSLSAADVAEPVLTDIVYLTQNGLLPAEPDYVTTDFINDYIAQCSLATKAAFAAEKARTGLAILDGRVAMTEELELFMRVI